jgi:uncharacterized protein with HEPN domain
VSRDEALYIEDMVQACEKVVRFTAGLEYDAFVKDERTYDAVLRNLEVIGEAAKRVPPSVRERMPNVPWRAICGFRDVLAHGYFALDDGIIWNAVQNEIPKLLEVVREHLKSREGGLP